jgi:membrane-associated protease RseP (regulator of RpoE activity)
MSSMMRRSAFALPLLAICAVPAATHLSSRHTTRQAAACPDPRSITTGFAEPLADVRYLADDALQGREIGTPGAHCAAEYIAARFRAMGLRPGAAGGSFFQAFPIRSGAAFGPTNDLVVFGRTWKQGRDWVPFGFSASTLVEAPLAYWGTGLSKPGDPTDRFSHMDVAGKVLVVEWGDPESPSGRSMRADPHFKATVAAARHAAGVLVLLPDGMELPSPESETRNPLAIPVAAVAAPMAATLREAAEAGAAARFQTDVHPTMSEAHNVVAVLPGSDPTLAAETIIVGGHFDHLGWGGEGALDPDVHAIHNGADDNASGTAGVLEIAGKLAAGPPLERTVVFVTFTGEERGLWGSAYYVAHPTVDLSKAVAMLNLDMVGRMVNDQLTVFGMGTAKEWDGLVKEVNGGLAQPMTLGFSPDGYGPSDHSSFYAAHIPVLHFFTGTHADYHRATDDWQKIVPGGIDRVTDLAAGIVRHLAGTADTSPMSVTFVEQAPPPAPSNASERSQGYGPYLGTIPDMTPRDFGVRLTGVREGSPAEQAGLRAGDVIVAFDGKAIADLYAYAYALRDKKPGDVVKIVVERDGKRMTVNAVLQAR